MTDVFSIESILLLALAALLIGAAVSDLARFVIPNWLNISVLVLGITYQAIYGDLTMALGAGFAILIFGFILFAFRALGGGDVKLLSATAVWVGFSGLPQFILYTAIAGGLLSIVWLMSGRLRQFIAYCGVNIDVEVPKVIPYGIAIAGAGLLMVNRLFTTSVSV